MIPRLFSSLLFFLITLPVAAQEPPGKLVGRVVDHANSKPLPGVRVSFQNTELNAITDNTGSFTFNSVPAGMQTMEVELIGYEKRVAPVRIVSREILEAEVRLTSKPIALPPLEVVVRSGRLASVGFYERRDEFGRQGRFMDRAYIEKRNPQMITDLFYNQPGLMVQYGGVGSRTVLVNRNGGCQPMVYVDGVLGDNRNYDAIRPEHVEGIEIYVGALIPIQYKSMTDCGVILTWTRRGRR
jgi:hypothetical protein